MCDILGICPVDIGQWLSYQPYSNQEQIILQKENLISTPLINKEGTVKFIYSKTIDDLEKYLENISSQIKIKDTEIALESEIFYTTKIEGAKTTRIRTTEIHNGAPISLNNEYSERMVKNGFEAVKLLKLYGKKITEDILLKTWNTLVDNVCNNEEKRGTKYRNGDIQVGSYVGLEHSKVQNSMNKWIEFYNSDQLNDKPFLKTAILHYSFETIHPFCDGNGRLGRLMMNHYLIGQNIESTKMVSFSKNMDQNRALYDASFVNAENRENDCTPFLQYMLETMANSFEEIYQFQQQEIDF